MSILDLILLAAGLSMDAFAVSICKGLSLRNVKWHHMMIVGLWFGIFQALMPSIGYVLGSLFIDLIDAYDHWITFILLSAIGLNMIKESREASGSSFPQAIYDADAGHCDQYRCLSRRRHLRLHEHTIDPFRYDHWGHNLSVLRRRHKGRRSVWESL